MSKKTLIIPDAHASPYHHNERFELLGKLIMDEMPDTIICIGDFADMPSLCVSPDTMILRGDLSWTKAEDLNIGDDILGIKENNGKKVGKGKSFRKFQRGVVTQNTRFTAAHGYKITTTHGEVTCSSDHKFLSHNLPIGAKRVYRTCDQLQPGWKIQSLGSDWNLDYGLTPQEIGYLQGFLDGEGSYSGGRLSWSQNNGAVADYVLSLMEKFNVVVRYYDEESRPNLRHYYIQGSYLESWRILHSVRPLRLMERLASEVDGKTCSKFSGIEDAVILNIEPMVNVEVIGLETSTSTYISNSLFSHNCSYDKGRKQFEGRRYKHDIESAIDAQQKMFAPLKAHNKRAKDTKHKQYKPKLHMILGNHDGARIERATNIQPELDGIISVGDLKFKEFGWQVHNFLDPVTIDGVSYSHYHTSGIMGKAISGEHQAHSLLMKKHMSCVQGHSHTRDMCERTTADGKRIIGLVVGCYLDVDQYEEYAGAANKLWWRGVVILHDVVDGEFEPQWINMKQIRKRYADSTH